MLLQPGHCGMGRDRGLVVLPWDGAKARCPLRPAQLTAVPGGHKEASERKKKNRIKCQACDLYAHGLLEPRRKKQRSGKRWAGKELLRSVSGLPARREPAVCSSVCAVLCSLHGAGSSNQAPPAHLHASLSRGGAGFHPWGFHGEVMLGPWGCALGSLSSHGPGQGSLGRLFWECSAARTQEQNPECCFP